LSEEPRSIYESVWAQKLVDAHMDNVAAAKVANYTPAAGYPDRMKVYHSCKNASEAAFNTLRSITDGSYSSHMEFQEYFEPWESQWGGRNRAQT